MNPTSLDPLRFPLKGSRLIEASAGTGKTFTIAALYLRLVLGHGGDAAFSRPLDPPEILVVTFTDAATKELRDRIRARLSEAAAGFLADPATIEPQPPGADLLHDLRAEYPPEDWAGCARRLQLAAEWMDEAAVSTIHGWCNRMLREHAFDSDSLFTQRLETDEEDLLAEVRKPPPVPTTSIYSKTDGIVAWQCSINPTRHAHTENIEVHASHIGMGMNPLAMYAIADRLRQDPAHWKRFDVQGARRWFFKVAHQPEMVTQWY